VLHNPQALDNILISDHVRRIESETLIITWSSITAIR
jgi:hypothetical protein